MQDPDVDPAPTETPGTGVFVPDTPSNDQPGQPAGAKYHTVEKGDTLYNISRRYGITVDMLKQLNNMTDNNIKIGQQLRVK
jgi:LysM repeat protein